MKTITLNRTQEQMLVEMLSWDREGYCYGYSKFEIPNGEGGYYNKNELKKEMKPMLDIGIVRCVRGLIDDDGLVCGSGFEIVSTHKEKIEKAIGRYIETDQVIERMSQSDDIFQKQLALLYKVGVPVQQMKLKEAFSGYFEMNRNRLQAELL